MANTRSATVTYAGTLFGSSETGQVLAFNRASMPDERFDPAGAYKGAADGGDLRLFVGGVGVPLEIVAIAYDSALGAGDGTFVAWARVDTTAATALELEWQYGDAALTQPAATDPLGSRAVWSDYAFVSHNGQTDSTGNHTITLGGSPSTTTGPFGDSAGAISLNGSTQYGQATVSLGANSYPWVAQVWVSATSGEITGRGAILGAFDDSNAADWYSVMQDGGEVWIHERQGGNIVAANAAIPGSLTAGVWARVTGVLIDTAHRVGYMNGGSKTTNTTVAFNAAFNMDRFSFGRWDDSTPSDYFGGSLAEMWVRFSQPSDGRIATEYNNQNPATAATYVTVGTPTSIGGGGTAFSASASGSATVSGSLIAVAAVTASASGAATGSGALQVAAHVAGTAAGAATVTSTLTSAARVSGAASGAATVAGSVRSIAHLLGSASGATVVSGTLAGGTDALSGNAAGQATVSGSITATARVTGSAAGAGSASGALIAEARITAAAAGTAAVSGGITDAAHVAGSVSGQSAATGNVISLALVRASAAGTATASATMTGIAIPVSVPPASRSAIAVGGSRSAITTEGSRRAIAGGGSRRAAA